MRKKPAGGKSRLPDILNLPTGPTNELCAHEPLEFLTLFDRVAFSMWVWRIQDNLDAGAHLHVV